MRSIIKVFILPFLQSVYHKLFSMVGPNWVETQSGMKVVEVRKQATANHIFLTICKAV